MLMQMVPHHGWCIHTCFLLSSAHFKPVRKSQTKAQREIREIATTLAPIPLKSIIYLDYLSYLFALSHLSPGGTLSTFYLDFNPVLRKIMLLVHNHFLLASSICGPGLNSTQMSSLWWIKCGGQKGVCCSFTVLCWVAFLVLWAEKVTDFTSFCRLLFPPKTTGS